MMQLVSRSCNHLLFISFDLFGCLKVGANPLHECKPHIYNKECNITNSNPVQNCSPSNHFNLFIICNLMTMEWLFHSFDVALIQSAYCKARNAECVYTTDWWLRGQRDGLFDEFDGLHELYCLIRYIQRFECIIYTFFDKLLRCQMKLFPERSHVNTVNFINITSTCPKLNCNFFQ